MKKFIYSMVITMVLGTVNVMAHPNGNHNMKPGVVKKEIVVVKHDNKCDKHHDKCNDKEYKKHMKKHDGKRRVKDCRYCEVIMRENHKKPVRNVRPVRNWRGTAVVIYVR